MRCDGWIWSGNWNYAEHNLKRKIKLVYIHIHTWMKLF
jgi:hypothetical protein